jgi:hypothetical protein
VLIAQNAKQEDRDTRESTLVKPSVLIKKQETEKQKKRANNRDASPSLYDAVKQGEKQI